MATLRIDHDARTLTIALTALEKVEAIHRDLVVPFGAVASVRSAAVAMDEVSGLRLPGTAVPGLEIVGTFVASDLGRTFAVCHGRGPGVVLVLRADLADNPTGYDRIVLTLVDPAEVVRALASR